MGEEPSAHRIVPEGRTIIAGSFKPAARLVPNYLGITVEAGSDAKERDAFAKVSSKSEPSPEPMALRPDES